MNYKVPPVVAADLGLSKEVAAVLDDLSNRYPESATIPAKEFAGRADERNELIDKGAIAKSPQR